MKFQVLMLKVEAMSEAQIALSSTHDELYISKAEVSPLLNTIDECGADCMGHMGYPLESLPSVQNLISSEAATRALSHMASNMSSQNFLYSLINDEAVSGAGLYEIAISRPSGGPITHRSRATGDNSIAFRSILEAFVSLGLLDVCEQCGAYVGAGRLNDDGCCDICGADDANLIRICEYHSNANGSSCVNNDYEDDYGVLSTGGGAEDLNETFGFELELSSAEGVSYRHERSKFRACSSLMQCLDSFKFQRDGSIGDGVEMISQPFTYDYLQSHDLIGIACEEGQFIGADDNDVNTGLHIHISKSALGKDQVEQAKNCMKLYLILSMYKEDFRRLSHRKASGMHFCTIPEPDDVVEAYNDLKAKIMSGNTTPFADIPYLKNMHAASNSALNCRGLGHTVEFRLFKSTTNPELFRAYLDLVRGLVKAVRVTPFEKIYCMRRFLRYVPEQTVSMFRKDGLFMRTVAVQPQSRGVSW